MFRGPVDESSYRAVEYEKYDFSSVGAALVNVAKSFYGTATVGERGQLVIPAEARNDLGIRPGDKILIMRHPAHNGLMMFKIEDARAFLDEFGAMLDNAERDGKERTEEK